MVSRHASAFPWKLFRRLIKAGKFPVFYFCSSQDTGIIKDSFEMGDTMSIEHCILPCLLYTSNIAILFASGAKIYLRSDTTMWSNYKERGNIIYNIEDIKHQSFEEFCQYDRENQVRNRTVIEQYTNCLLYTSRCV